MSQIFSNGARAELDTSITADSVSLSVITGGDLFPVANYAGVDTLTQSSIEDWFKLVLQDDDGYEIVYCYRHDIGSNNFLNLRRGQEGTVARPFATGTIVGLRPLAKDMADLVLSNQENKANLANKADKTGDISGNAGTATKLESARALSISGGVTAAAKNFDGSMPVDLEVTAIDVSKANQGTLSVARGGTGTTTATGTGKLVLDNSPEFTGTPTAPTASAGTNNTQLATTGFVAEGLSGKSDTNHTHSIATTSSNGFMSSTDKTKLDGIELRVDKAVLSYPNYAAASAAASKLPDGQEIEAPNSDGRLSRFGVQGEALVFKDYAPDAIRMQSYTELRAYTGKAQAINITTRGIAGLFNLDYSDIVTSDNGGTVIVDASNRRWKRDHDGVVLLDFFGAKFDGSDESTIAIKCLAATNTIFVQKGKRLVCKNVELASGSSVTIAGSVELPDNCSDFDRCFYGYDKPNIEVVINEIDGNFAGQTGSIATHLIYMVRCDDAKIHVKNAHDHYIASDAAMPDVAGDGRNASTGAIWLYRCERADVKIDLLSGWGREGVYLEECVNSDATMGHAQGIYNTEYSGLQVKGVANNVLRASVDNAGASAVGFDTINGTLSNVIATNTRENSGVNFGHIGFPATGSVASNIIVDGAFGYGISVGAGSHDVTISNFNVKNTGEMGVSFSDGVLRGKLSDGVVAYPSQYSLGASGAEVQTSNVRSIDRDAATLLVNVTSGKFVDGDAVSSVGGTAEIRKALGNLTGSKQRLFFRSNIPASYSVGQTITGTNGAIGTIEGVYVPVEYYEGAGGRVVPDARAYEAGASSQIRFSDGTAIYRMLLPCVYTTSGAMQSFTHNFTSNVEWINPPSVSLSLTSFDNTSGFSIDFLIGTATESTLNIYIKASVNQTYGVVATAIGRWK